MPELREIEITEVSLVDKPASGIKFCLIKMLDPKKLPEPEPPGEAPKLGDVGFKEFAEAVSTWRRCMKALSISDREQAIRSAIDALNAPQTYEWGLREAFDSHAIVQHSPKGKPETFYRISFTADVKTGAVTLSPRNEWIEGSLEFVTASGKVAE